MFESSLCLQFDFFPTDPQSDGWNLPTSCLLLLNEIIIIYKEESGNTESMILYQRACVVLSFVGLRVPLWLPEKAQSPAPKLPARVASLMLEMQAVLHREGDEEPCKEKETACVLFSCFCDARSFLTVFSK